MSLNVCALVNAWGDNYRSHAAWVSAEEILRRRFSGAGPSLAAGCSPGKAGPAFQRLEEGRDVGSVIVKKRAKPDEMHQAVVFGTNGLGYSGSPPPSSAAFEKG